MPTKRTRRTQSRRTELTPALRRCLGVGKHQAQRELNEYVVTERELEALWREHGPEIVADWIREHPGTRPWSWWQYGAPEPRRVLRGTALLMPRTTPTDWEFVWRDHFGVPAFIHSRPRGFIGLPEVEGQGAYLRRLGLLAPHECPAPGTLEPEAVDPFLTYEGELEEQAARARREVASKAKMTTNGVGAADEDAEGEG